MSSFSKLQKILLLCCAAIVCFVLITTLALLISGKLEPGKDYRKADIAPEKLVQADKSGNTEVFTDLGTIRTGTRDEPSIPIVIKPYFSYPADDTEYYEELCRKTRRIQQFISLYFADFTKEELMMNGEQKAKQDILQLINDDLVLGQIPAIYFEQYIFFD